MSEEEILNKYIDLIDKGYCSDCNELNCIDNFPHSKITHAIRELQQENKILKENAEHNDKVVDKVNWENQLLKKENQALKKKYENAVADYESVMFEKEQLNSLVNSCQEEIRQLKKQLENKYEKVGTLTSELLYEENTKLINQQKEFIKYLENEIYSIEPKGTGINYYCEYDSEEDYISAMKEQSKLNTLKEILSKYKEIIGDECE